jgi:hypothetical protein
MAFFGQGPSRERGSDFVSGYKNGPPQKMAMGFTGQPVTFFSRNGPSASMNS